ncbi:hypothetical protein [Zobellella iuensis]|nr:hypothetical protein [Zobellella iuensis]
MPVTQRQVFYIHGFDPRGASHYHSLYRSQSARQAKINGLEIGVSRRRRHSAHVHRWQLNTAHTQTDYCYLGWDDIIRQNWSKSWPHILSDLVYCLWAYIFTGRIFSFARASHKQMIAGLYPALYILCSITLGAWAAFSLATSWPWGALPPALALMMQWLAPPALFALWMMGCKRLGDKLAVFWLLRIYAFSVKWANGKVPELDNRINQFAEQIIDAVRNDANNEIVIVAHSVGTMVAMPAMAKALAALPQDQLFANQRVVLITLGECIPLISFQPAARDFRAALEQLGQDPRLLWLDYTAPTDGACFPLLDPVTSCGLRRAPNAGPRLLSPRFFTLYEANHYKQLRRAWYTMHFLYLMATDKPGPYDFFAFTAGPLAMTHRLKEQP